MSDNFLRLIPEDPRFVPDAARQARAQSRFAELAPDSDEIECHVSEEIEFFDCAANFERILCPTCKADIPVDWWHARMEEDFEEGFTLAKYALPCCNAAHTLHDLDYEWPQGFGKFALRAMNPNISELSDEFKQELEEVLGTKLRVIYQHI